MKKILMGLTALLSLGLAQAQINLGNLPSGYIGYVANPSTDELNIYNFGFTATTTGSNYVGFAFRQDPAFWQFMNPSVVANGTSTNLLVNSNFLSGGAVQVNTAQGVQTIQAPTNWGVWYQNNSYPYAAGTWLSGMWYDGAVGMYDGIYQGINMTAGTSYTISFNAFSTFQASSTEQAIVGVYAGTCANVLAAPGACAPNNDQFMVYATPNQTVNAGDPNAAPVSVAPTIVSTQPGTPQTSLSSSTGTPVTTTTAAAIGASVTVLAAANSRGTATPRSLSVTQTTTATTTTPVAVTATTTTPVTTTITTTPSTVTTWSDNSVTIEQGTPEVTTTTTELVTTTVTNGTEVVSATSEQEYSTRVDQFTKLNEASRSMNESLESQPFTRIRAQDGKLTNRDLSGRDYNFYITGTGLKSNTADSYNYSGNIFGFGIEKLLSKSTLLGAQYNRGQINMTGYNAGGSLTKDMVGLYGVQMFESDIMVKADLGYAQNSYNTAHSIPELGLGNTGSANGQDYWAQVKTYSPAVYGVRAFVGGRTENNQINATQEQGSALTAMSYSAVNTTKNTGLGGVMINHNFTKNWAVGGEYTRTTSQANITSLNVTYHDSKNSSVLLKIAQGDQNNVTVNSATLQARVAF